MSSRCRTVLLLATTLAPFGVVACSGDPTSAPGLPFFLGDASGADSGARPDAPQGEAGPDARDSSSGPEAAADGAPDAQDEAPGPADAVADLGADSAEGGPAADASEEGAADEDAAADGEAGDVLVAPDGDAGADGAPCPHLCGSACVDTQTDDSNCGQCGIACPAFVPMGWSACVAGACVTQCETGHGDCNDEPDDGCETPLTSLWSCGACGQGCPSGASCVALQCACPPGTLECTGGCVDTSIDEANCGQCGRACPPKAKCTGGACACPAGRTDCGVVCADLMSDPHHCGACGHDCQGAACSDACCLPSLLYENQMDPMTVGLDDGYVYWGGVNAGLRRGPVTGGQYERVLQSPTAVMPLPLEFDEEYIYFIGSRYSGGAKLEDRIGRAPKAGAAWSDTVLLAGAFLSGFEFDGAWFYWADYTTDENAGSIRRRHKGAGVVELLASGQQQPRDLVWKNGYLYWANKGGGTVLRVAPGSTPEVLVDGQEEVWALAVDDVALYWSSRTAGLWRLQSRPIEGGPVKLLWDSEDSAPTMVLVDGVDVYFNYWNVLGHWLKRMPKSGGTPRSIGGPNGNLRDVAFDACCVYWVDSTGGKVWRIAK